MKTIKLMTCALFACIALAACKKDPATEPDPVKYTVTVSAGENGKAAASVAEAEAGAEVTFTATPDEGFAFDKWTVEKGNVTVANPAENPLKVTMPKENISLSASFVALKFPHAIKIAEAENGTVTIEGDLKEAIEGDNVTVTAVPAEGFEFKGWTLDGVEVEDLAANPLTFVMPDAEVTVAAEFKEIFNIITWADEYIESKREAYGDRAVDACKENVASFFEFHMENSSNLTDPLTEEPILDMAWDSNGDGILSLDEAAKVKMINLEESIGTLSFLQYFTGLEIIACNENYSPFSGYGEIIDLSEIRNLRYADLADCGSIDVNLGEKPVLEHLDLAYAFDHNYTINVELFSLSQCPSIKYLDLRRGWLGDASEESVVQVDLRAITLTDQIKLGSYRSCGGEYIISAEQEAKFNELFPNNKNYHIE